MVLVMVMKSATVSSPVDQAPTISITSPASSSVLFENEAVVFSGIANDLEDGDLSSSISWSSSIDGILGSGSTVNANLTAGSHQITATITDSAGDTRTASITIELDGIRGDINDDGTVNIQDLVLLQQHLLTISIIADNEGLRRADVYPADVGDGELTISDLLLLLR